MGKEASGNSCSLDGLVDVGGQDVFERLFGRESVS